MVLAGAIPAEQDPVHAADAVVRGLVARPRLRDLRGRPHRLADHRGPASGRGASSTAINLYDDEHVAELSAVNVALHAHALLERDVDYIVRDGTVELVDEMRGRVAQRRRWPDGLHAAVEAKEGLDASAEGEVLGTITIQAYVGLYPTLCGMTATAVHVGDQLREYFKLEVAVIPSNTAVHPRGRAGPDLRHQGREGRGAGRAGPDDATRAAGRC